VRPLLPLARLALETAADQPAVVDAALGLTRPRRYLVLLQNPWELRPAGGFITAAVLVSVAGGSFELGSFINSWDVDRHPEALPPPPPSLYQAIWAGKINFLNSNWSPDFPTSAGWAQRLYQIGQDDPLAFDGAIALDPVVVQLLLEVVGPVHIPEYRSSVSADDLWEQLIAFHDEPLGLEAGASHGEKLFHRKEFLPLVAQPLLAKLLAEVRNPESVLAIAQAMIQALDERHLLVAAADAQVASWLADQKWDGALWQGAGDYIKIVDANVGFNKANARVTRNVIVDVALGPKGDAIARVSIQYENHSQVDSTESCVQELPSGDYAEGWVDACYWTFTRLYTPAGSQLLSAVPDQWPPNTLWEQKNPTAANPGVQVGPESLGRQVFGTMIVVAPGEKKTIRFEYALPPGIWNARDGYQLYLQKQSGTISTTAHVTINLPDGTTVIETNGALTETGVKAEMALVTDKSIFVTLGGKAVEQLAARPAVSHTPTTQPSPTPTPTAIPIQTPGPTPTPVSLLVTATPTVIPTPGETSTHEAPELAPMHHATWTRIQAPAANIDATIVEVGIKLVGLPETPRAEWEVAAFAAGHHRDSAYPGEVGNIVLTAHHNILGEVFRDLWELEPGDEIFLTDSNSIVYRYVTRQVHILQDSGLPAADRAAHLQYLERRPEPILTLVTCWPYETNTHRTVVVADLFVKEQNSP